MHDEELAAVRVLAVVRHRKQTAPIATAVERGLRLDLVLEVSTPGTLSAGAVPLGIAALNHEAAHDPMERQAVVVPVLGEQPEVLDRFRRIVRKELNVDVAVIGFDGAM